MIFGHAGDLNHCATYPASGTLFITCVKKKDKCTKPLHQNSRKVACYKKRGLVPSNVVSLALLLVRQHYWYVFVFMLYIELFNSTPPPFFSYWIQGEYEAALDIYDSEVNMYVNLSLHPNLSINTMYSPYIVLYTIPEVLTQRICTTIKNFFRWWSFPLFSWPLGLGEIKCSSPPGVMRVKLCSPLGA